MDRQQLGDERAEPLLDLLRVRLVPRRLVRDGVGQQRQVERRLADFQFRFQVTRIDLEKQIARLDRLPDVNGDLGDHSGHRRADQDVLGAGLDDPRTGDVVLKGRLGWLGRRRSDGNGLGPGVHHIEAEQKSHQGDRGKDVFQLQSDFAGRFKARWNR